MESKKYSSIKQIVGESRSEIAFPHSMSLEQAEKYLEIKGCEVIDKLSYYSNNNKQFDFRTRNGCILEVKDRLDVLGWIAIEPKDHRKPFLGINVHSSAEDVLRNDYSKYGYSHITLREYVEYQASSDPGFFRWLFGDNLEDFGSDLTETHKKVYQEFLNKL